MAGAAVGLVEKEMHAPLRRRGKGFVFAGLKLVIGCISNQQCPLKCGQRPRDIQRGQAILKGPLKATVVFRDPTHFFDQEFFAWVAHLDRVEKWPQGLLFEVLGSPVPEKHPLVGGVD